ncbi:hypothetical protein BESB_072960 [Besnoitia besnoiti]|uniref:Leucine rich repeat-containing protein n=1 Tax=Besnoitia besnoiti TaxID=94643 RepID=A0A2A9MAC4_BESBE|nr:uncharacterized protein BESB_072960 [Besnoitia besnoiti]PFH34144.1 hypothetical protein BESB_072960 [Besnoitia besnoiti]
MADWASSRGAGAADASSSPVNGMGTRGGESLEREALQSPSSSVSSAPPSCARSSSGCSTPAASVSPLSARPADTHEGGLRGGDGERKPSRGERVKGSATSVSTETVSTGSSYASCVSSSSPSPGGSDPSSPTSPSPQPSSASAGTRPPSPSSGGGGGESAAGAAAAHVQPAKRRSSLSPSCEGVASFLSVFFAPCPSSRQALSLLLQLLSLREIVTGLLPASPLLLAPVAEVFRSLHRRAPPRRVRPALFDWSAHLRKSHAEATSMRASSSPASPPPSETPTVVFCTPRSAGLLPLSRLTLSPQHLSLLPRDSLLNLLAPPAGDRGECISLVLGRGKRRKIQPFGHEGSHAQRGACACSASGRDRQRTRVSSTRCACPVGSADALAAEASLWEIDFSCFSVRHWKRLGEEGDDAAAVSGGLLSPQQDPEGGDRHRGAQKPAAAGYSCASGDAARSGGGEPRPCEGLQASRGGDLDGEGEETGRGSPSGARRSLAEDAKKKRAEGGRDEAGFLSRFAATGKLRGLRISSSEVNMHAVKVLREAITREGSQRGREGSPQRGSPGFIASASPSTCSPAASVAAPSRAASTSRGIAAFSLHHCGVSMGGFHALCVSVLPLFGASLRELSVVNCRLAAADMSALSLALVRLPSVEVLDLADNLLRDEGAITLLLALISSHRLFSFENERARSAEPAAREDAADEAEASSAARDGGEARRQSRAAAAPLSEEALPVQAAAASPGSAAGCELFPGGRFSQVSSPSPPAPAGLRSLNLSGNEIEGERLFRVLLKAYVGACAADLEVLDLANNRLDGDVVLCLRDAMAQRKRGRQLFQAQQQQTRDVQAATQVEALVAERDSTKDLDGGDFPPPEPRGRAAREAENGEGACGGLARSFPVKCRESASEREADAWAGAVVDLRENFCGCERSSSGEALGSHARKPVGCLGVVDNTLLSCGERRRPSKRLHGKQTGGESAAPSPPADESDAATARGVPREVSDHGGGNQRAERAQPGAETQALPPAVWRCGFLIDVCDCRLREKARQEEAARRCPWVGRRREKSLKEYFAAWGTVQREQFRALLAADAVFTSAVIEECAEDDEACDPCAGAAPQESASPEPETGAEEKELVAQGELQLLEYGEAPLRRGDREGPLAVGGEAEEEKRRARSEEGGRPLSAELTRCAAGLPRPPAEAPAEGGEEAAVCLVPDYASDGLAASSDASEDAEGGERSRYAGPRPASRPSSPCLAPPSPFSAFSSASRVPLVAARSVSWSREDAARSQDLHGKHAEAGSDADAADEAGAGGVAMGRYASSSSVCSEQRAGERSSWTTRGEGDEEGYSSSEASDPEGERGYEEDEEEEEDGDERCFLFRGRNQGPPASVLLRKKFKRLQRQLARSAGDEDDPRLSPRTRLLRRLIDGERRRGAESTAEGVAESSDCAETDGGSDEDDTARVAARGGMKRRHGRHAEAESESEATELRGKSVKRRDCGGDAATDSEGERLLRGHSKAGRAEEEKGDDADAATRRPLTLASGDAADELAPMGARKRQKKATDDDAGYEAEHCREAPREASGTRRGPAAAGAPSTRGVASRSVAEEEDEDESYKEDEEDTDEDESSESSERSDGEEDEAVDAEELAELLMEATAAAQEATSSASTRGTRGRDDGGRRDRRR